MATYVGFLRAVNVGKRKVPMAQLRELLADSGCTYVVTHIQTGNVRFDSRARSNGAVETKLEKLLEQTFGFEVATLVRTPAQLRAVVANAPTSPLGEAGRHYVTFLRRTPSKAAAEAINGWDEPGEAARVVGSEVHMWLDKPTQDAKLSNARLERLAGIDGTNRNWTVVSALAEKWA